MAKLDEFGWLKRAENKVRKLRDLQDEKYFRGGYHDPDVMHGLASIAAALRNVRDILEESRRFKGRPLAKPTPTPEQVEIERIFLVKAAAQNDEIRSL